VTTTYYDKRLTSRFPLGDVALKKCAAQDSIAPAARDVSGTYTYLSRGIAKVEQRGNDVRMLMTWTPAGAGPHYEVRAKLTGNTIEGKWYSHYARKSWFYFNGEVSPSGEMIDLSKSEDPIRSNINRSKLIKN
jgi:hypothetical protein